MNRSVETVAGKFAQTYPTLAHLREALICSAQALCECHHRGGLILLCGNGGSAADCAHIVGELMKGFQLRRRLSQTQLDRFWHVTGKEEGLVFERLQQGVRAVNLAEASALNTAVANDQSPELIFAQSVFALGRPGDVLIALSTSGNSMNVVRALQVAKAQGLTTLGFTGEGPAQMDDYCDHCLKAPAHETAAVQEYHLPMYHALCAMAEAELFGPETGHP